MKDKIAKFGKMLGMIDSIFAQVRGVKAGLLPTEEQIGTLETTIGKWCELWLGCGFSTNQPKWHLLFDGHLVDQVHMFWGLAEKLDDVTEKAHQPWKREKEQTWNFKKFKMQQKEQLAAVRKQNHCKIQAELKITCQLHKHAFTNNKERKRKAEAKVKDV